MLYVFEGPDSVGKSTISASFANRLKGDGRCVVRYWSFPGRDKGTLGWAVYRLHHNSVELGVSAITPTSLQVMHIAAHVDAIESRILPALDAGEIVVLDRFWWSTLVYGIVKGASAGSLSAMIEVELKAWRGVEPGVAFLIDRTTPFSLRSGEQIGDWQRLREEYRSLAERQSSKHRVVRITNENGVESATTCALAAVSQTREGSVTVNR